MTNKKVLPGMFVILLVSGMVFVSCNDLTGGGSSSLTDLQKYQNVGASVAAKEWTENYDCSNFSTQFYQNCFKAGLPCRVRIGESSLNNLSAVGHAWNSVKIDGIWVNWEPQANSVYNGHRQTRTQIGPGCGNFVEEDIIRIIYETIGKYVPSNIIDTYEIDAYWGDNSPFYQYFLSVSDCLSDDQDQNVQDLVSYLQSKISDNGSGNIFISDDQLHLAFFFRYNNKYYGIENLEESDPLEGRSVTKTNNLKDIIISSTGFTALNINPY